MSEHKFRVGQTVMIASADGRGGSNAAVIVRLVPAAREDLEPQYRVKNRTEAHERIVPEGMIRTSGASL